MTAAKYAMLMIVDATATEVIELRAEAYLIEMLLLLLVHIKAYSK